MGNPYSIESFACTKNSVAIVIYASRAAVVVNNTLLTL